MFRVAKTRILLLCSRFLMPCEAGILYPCVFWFRAGCFGPGYRNIDRRNENTWGYLALAGRMN